MVMMFVKKKLFRNEIGYIMIHVTTNLNYLYTSLFLYEHGESLMMLLMKYRKSVEMSKHLRR